MRTTAANYRGGIASLLAGTRALGQGMQDLNTGLYGFTPKGRREAEMQKMLDEAMKKRAGMDMDAADAPPPPDPRLAGMSRLPFDTDAPLAPPLSVSSALTGAPGMPVKPPAAAGMPAPAKGALAGFPLVGGAAPGVFNEFPSPPPLPGAPGLTAASGKPPLTPDDQAMLSQTGLGSLLGMPSASKGGSPATRPAQGAAQALTIQKRDPFAAGPLAAPPPSDPFGGERKGLLLDRAIATLQKNPGQASAMTDRLLGRAQEDTPDAIQADIELLGSLDGSPESYRSAMPQMRSNLGRKELFAQITEGINRKRGEEAEVRKFGQQKELKKMEEEGATGRTKMTVDARESLASHKPNPQDKADDFNLLIEAGSNPAAVQRAAIQMKTPEGKIQALRQIGSLAGVVDKRFSQALQQAGQLTSQQGSLLRQIEVEFPESQEKYFNPEEMTDPVRKKAYMDRVAKAEGFRRQAEKVIQDAVLVLEEAEQGGSPPNISGGQIPAAAPPAPSAPPSGPPLPAVPSDAKAKADAILVKYGGDREKAANSPEGLALKVSLGGEATKGSEILFPPPPPPPEPRQIPRKSLGEDLPSGAPEWKDSRTEDQILAEVEAAIGEQKRLPLQSQDIEGAVRRVIERPLAREKWERDRSLEQGRQAGEAHRSAEADIAAADAEKAGQAKKVSADEAKQWLTKVRQGR